MHLYYQKLPLVIELFFNGVFILLFALVKAKIKLVGTPAQVSQFVLEYGRFWVPVIISFVSFTNALRSASVEEFFRKHVFSLIVLVPLYIAWGDSEFSFWLAAVHLFSSILSMYENETQLDLATSNLKFNIFDKIKNDPSKIVLITFAATIMVGALLLVLPISTEPGKNVSFIDALFISTSAVCVTGLASISIADSFTTVGEIIVVFLIQVGGLGIMTLSSSLMIFMGRSMAMKDQLVMKDILDISSMEELFQLIIDIIKFTFFIELVGAILLTVGFYNEGLEFSEAIYWGFFHSVSAFCNAGFGLYNNSLENFVSNPIINFTISGLIILGGIGFVVLKDIQHLFLDRKSVKYLTTHSKVVIVTSVILILTGMIYIFFSEYLHGLDQYDFFDKLMISFFQSVTTRTAGFNTIALLNLHTHTISVIIILMFIGASPGSTGGGVKTTTFAVLFQSLIVTLRGQHKVEFFDRRIPESIVLKSTAIFIISIMIVVLGMLLLLRAEPEQPFLYLLFEVVSAFATVGLSLGITPYLTTMGKLIIILIMYIGRVGPLTMAVAIGQRKIETGNLEHPEGRVLIG